MAGGGPRCGTAGTRRSGDLAGPDGPEPAVEVGLHGLGGERGHLVGGGGPRSRPAPRTGRRRGCGAAGPARRATSGRPRRHDRHRTPPSTMSKATSWASSSSPHETQPSRNGAEPSRASTLRKKAGATMGESRSARAARARDGHLVEPRIGVALLAHLVDHLEHGQGRRHPVEVLADRPEGVDDLDLVDGVEVAPALPAEEGDVAEGLEARPELRRRPAHALGHGPDLAVVLGHQGDDPVRLAQPDGAQHHPPVAELRHRPDPGPRPPPSAPSGSVPGVGDVGGGRLRPAPQRGQRHGVGSVEPRGRHGRPAGR